MKANILIIIIFVVLYQISKEQVCFNNNRPYIDKKCEYYSKVQATQYLIHLEIDNQLEYFVKLDPQIE